jgi:hypothetical protein
LAQSTPRTILLGDIARGVHRWAVPRYNQPVTLGGWTFADPDFGHPYSPARWLEVPAGLRQAIVARIQLSLAA